MSDLENIRKIKSLCLKELDKGIIASWQSLLDYSSEFEFESQSLYLIKSWYDSIYNFSFLKDIPLDTEEIFFHSADLTEILTENGKRRYEHDLTQEDLETVYKIIALKHNIDWNYKEPFCSFSFKFEKKEIRVSLIHQSLSSTKRPKGFFRFLNNKVIPIEKYEHSKILNAMIESKKNILISGSTGSGKTTLTNSLLNLIPKEEHILILEDTKELIIRSENTTSLLSNKKFDQSLDTLLAYGLRISPERVILGEMRSKEVTSFLLAMNTGHKGMISTIHANNAKDTVHRIALMFMMYGNMNLSYELVLKLVCQNIDHIVFIENKKIKEIINLYGAEGSTIFHDSMIKQDTECLQEIQSV